MSVHGDVRDAVGAHDVDLVERRALLRAEMARMRAPVRADSAGPMTRALVEESSGQARTSRTRKRAIVGCST
jgi:hypothetical protein